jgi:hypothetical protein
MASNFAQTGMGIYFYHLFKTSAPDGSAFFGIYKSTNPSWNQDGIPINYIGSGAKLAAKAKRFGIHRLVTETIASAATYDELKPRLDRILTPATLADPLCLNMPMEDRNQKISEALTGKSKSEEHKESIAVAMVGNDNAIGHVKSDETKAAIGEARSKQKWYHNKTTGEEIILDEDEEVLTGFELGHLPKELASRFKKDRKHNLTDAERAKLIKD